MRPSPPPHDLAPFGAVRIDGHAVVIRGGGEVARANPVLDDEHAVAAEAADDRPAGAGTEGWLLLGASRAISNGIDRGDRVEPRRRSAPRRRPPAR